MVKTPTIIFSAPMGWGKTRNAEQLRKEFGCKSIIEEWFHNRAIVPGALHLTNASPDCIRAHIPEHARLVERGWPQRTGSRRSQ